MVYAAKTQTSRPPSDRLRHAAWSTSTRVGSPEELLPLLESFPDRTERADELFQALEAGRPVQNVGALARKPVPRGAAWRN